MEYGIPLYCRAPVWLAALHVGRRSLPGTVYYGGCAGRRPWMEYGIPLYCRAPVCSYRCSCSQSSSVEKEADIRRESGLLVHRGRQKAPVHWRDCQAPRCKRDSGGLFLLQRSGADGGTLGWQLSGAVQGNFSRGGGRFCQPVFPWNYGGKSDQRLSDYEAGGYPDDTPWRSCDFSGNSLPFPALPFSATALWSRRRDFGLAAIWCCAGEFQQRRRPVLSACFSLELRREERSAAF